MPSTYSSRLRLNFQAPGDNLNTWGTVLNTAVHQLLEDAIAKRVDFSLSGAKTLSSANGAEDEARSAYLDVTSGTGGTITIPSVEKLYVVRNAASGDVSVTTGGMTNALIKSGEIGWVVCDGANVRRVQFTDLGGARLTGLATPVSGTDGATKAYVDAVAWAVNAGILPGQDGNAGKFLKTDGTDAAWGGLEAIAVSGGMELSGSTKSNVVAATALDLDLAAAEFFTKSIAVNSAFTFSNAVASKGMAFTLELTLSAGAVPSWPASVDFPAGGDPSTGLGDGKHLLGFITYNGGTDWVMLVMARNVS